MDAKPQDNVDNEDSEESSEADSLDSQAEVRKEAKRLAKEALLAELDTGPPIPELDEEDLNKLIGYVKNITTLYDLQQEDWTQACDEVIRSFFMDTTQNALSIYFDNNELKCMLGFPSTPIIDLTYFIRRPFEIYTPSNFHDLITFGTVDDSIEGSLLKVIENIYAPIFFNITSWPESVRSDFCTHLHNFLAKLTDLHYKMLGLTVIYIPNEGANLSLDDAAKDKDLIKRLEGVVVHWSKQIKMCLGDQKQSAPNELLRPIDEYDFWIYRYENLSGLNYQLQNKNLKRICDILKASHSSYIVQFLNFVEQIDQNMIEAKSNIEFLQILIKPCKELRACESPNNIPDKIPELLNLIRIIWNNSPFYNTKERITTICRQLTNEVIHYCRKYIDLTTILNGKTKYGIQTFETCIQCCVNYKYIYFLMADAHTEICTNPWNLQTSHIFTHLDAFIQRCYDMIEVCECMIIFARMDETEKIPKPLFGTAKGEMFEKMCDKVEQTFLGSLKNIVKIHDKILDIQNQVWLDEIMKFRQNMENLELIVTNLIDSIFDQIANIYEGVECLAGLFNYSRRPLLEPLFSKKIQYMYKMFMDEINATKDELTNTGNECYSMLPYYGGRAWLAQLKIQQLMNTKNYLDEAVFIPHCNMKDDVYDQYEKQIKVINDYIQKLYNEWIATLDTEMAKSLDRPLIAKSLTHPGLLECNLHRKILQSCYEAQYWEYLVKYEVPFHMRSIYVNYDGIKLIYEKVLTVVINYNKIISALSDEERILFRPLIGLVDKKIIPGIHALTWNTEVADEYIAECCGVTTELQDFLNDYKKCNLEIIKMCENICNFPFLVIPGSYVFELDELFDYIRHYISDASDKLGEMYREILKYLIVVYEGFEKHITNMIEAWDKYIKNFDAILEQAIKIAIKNSLDNAKQALHGDSTTGPSPLLKVEADLTNNRIDFEPSINDIAKLVASIRPQLILAVKPYKRLSDKFKVYGVRPASFDVIIEKDKDCADIQAQLNNEVMVNISMMHNYLKVWEPYRDLWEVDKDRFIGRYEKQNPDAATFDANIGRYTEVANNVQQQESVSIVHFILVNATPLKKSIMDHCISWQQKLCQLLLQMTDDKVTKVYQYINDNSEKIQHVPENLDEMQQSLILYDFLVEDSPIRCQEFDLINDQFLTLDKYEVEVPVELRHLGAGILAKWQLYLEILHEAEKMIYFKKDTFKAQLLDSARDLKERSNKILESFVNTGPFTADVTAKEALNNLDLFRAKLKELRNQENKLKKDLGIFNISQPDSPELAKLEKDLAALQLVWELTEQWDDAWEKYKYGEFWYIDTEEMEQTAQTLFRKLTRLSRELKDRGWSIVEHTRKRVDTFRRTLPLISDLKNPAMRPRHWDRVKAIMSVDFDQDSSDFTLGAIIEMKMQDYADHINEISNAASMELQIENGLKTINNTWLFLMIDIVPYRDGIYKIKSVDDCFTTLEENIVTLSTMKSTRFVEPFAKEVDYWERALSYIMETLEVALLVQRQWFYLENIFLGEDIRKQLPKESANFDGVTAQWKIITSSMYNAQSALQATHYRPPPYLLNKLNNMNEKLEIIQRELEKYLETKRHIFPRFYFISNDEMLEILGNAKKPEAVQPHLKKLYDNINKIRIGKHASTGRTQAEGMFSEDGEYIEFNVPATIDGPAESWLLQLEKTMRNTLKLIIKPCRQALRKNLKTRDKWLAVWCGQLCNTACLMQWTTDCTRTLMQCKIIESRSPLKKLRKKQKQILGMLSEMSRRDLDKIMRLKVNALCIIEIHAKDVIDKMYKTSCMDISAFEWFSQLRFYWDRDVDDCVIRQTNTYFKYGYEYIGNSGRLVITPLTDRCYITLTTALHLNRGGSPKGPAGTGKTETVKDLGKAMGMWVIVNNCSEGLDFKSMGKMFSGLAQTGAWGCFDEFNRINIEVLSVVAQQILSVLSAISQKLRRFCFEGQEINLVLTVGIFITMNPGYAGRTELPDNLKSMFRPISMIVPDNVIIAENILFSDGFIISKLLAKKVFTLYQLSMQQLSKQDHYDFGLRSMVALLRYGGRKRRAYPTVPEEEIMYLAMRDMNIAKLSADDLPLFNGIVSDIFPGIQIPTIDYEDLNNAITAELKSLSLQCIQTAITKVIQLYETKNSRHAVMILGKTCTAKTVTWKVLKGSMGRLRKQKKAGFNTVYEYPLNPKSLSLGELYGEYNLSTNEWLDGVLSAIMRKVCAEETPDEKWILFDGPVDAVWIENMNSVMDDNKVLTLINSERITMPEQVSLLFEVGDLSVASPATVSRSGMVYNDYKDWGWRPYVASWIEKQPDKKYQELMADFFDRYVSSILNFKKVQCEEPVAVNELSSIISHCKLLDCFATKENGIDSTDTDSFETMGKMWFMFCLIWSVCATVDEPGRKKLDVFIREKEGIFPLRDTIYEYYIDVRNKTFISWEDKLPKSWQYDPSAPFYKIVVPTIDTIRYECIVGTLLGAGQPCLVTGPVGTGKTSTAQSVASCLDPTMYTILAINMSAQTTSNNVQETIESRVEKRTKGVYVPMGGKKMVAFLDDLNMPAKDTYGSQPPLELLRQWLDYGFWYDRRKQWRTYIKNMFILAAMGPPGGGRTVISDRLLSCFNVINMTFPDSNNITRIFDTMLHQHISNFDDEVKRTCDKVTESTISLYTKVSLKMLPTPAKIHYLFNLRDISKVFQGLLRSNKDAQSSKQAILRLWVHECYRVFFDRLIDDKDRDWFNNTMNEFLGLYFEVTLNAVCPKWEIPIFGHFMSAYSQYEDLNNLPILRKFLETQMEEYNSSPGVVRQDLVLFLDAISHICKIIRVISQPRGNVLLVGIGGSGRQSLSRIASYICEYVTFQIEVKKNYKMQEFREDLKVLYGMTGVDMKETSFLFNDTQIAEESFLEVINNMLSSGEVSNLFKPDEFEDIRNKLADAIKKGGISSSTEAVYAFLIERVRKNMHIVLCMSPVGDSFRNRLRQYPSLVNCTTIDWFTDWPKIALLEVANKYLSDVNFVATITGDIQLAGRKKESITMITQDRLREAVASIFSLIHDSVAKCSQRMKAEIKRNNYVTPTNYLELVTGYKNLLNEKRDEYASQANKLRNGLSKIDTTKAAVEVMGAELEVASVKVVEFQHQCDEYMVVIVNQTNEADEKQKQVTLDSIKIKQEEEQCLKLAAQAQADLDLAMPALEEAVRALDSLNKKDVSEVRSYGKPPQKVKMVLEAVMILKGVDTSWEEAKRQLADNNFLNNLKEFDKNHVSDKTLRKIATYTMDDEFQPDKVGIVSFAAKSLCMWVRAIEKYAKVYRIVAPKQEKLEQALKSLQEKQQMLAAARKKLEELSQMLEKLKADYDVKLKEKEDLQKKAEQLLLKLERAALLVECLASERDRWEQTVANLDNQFSKLPGDCLLATAFVSYLGPFTSIYREDLSELWINEVKQEELPHTFDFNVIKFLSDPIKIREWTCNGLPSDEFSTENGLIINRCSRWPLVIDPQCQAQKWIKQMEKNLKVIDLGMANFMKTVERAVQFGHPVLLQNILEDIDPSLSPILQKSLIKQGGQLLIKLSDKTIDYNPNFKFYITTKLSNPHYPPEISTKATVVNFAVKEQGLEDQLLGNVVRMEQYQLEEQKDKLVVTIATGKATLRFLEDELLRLLNEAKGSLLDDEALVSTLKNSKDTSIAVKLSLATSEVTEVEIDQAREGYRPCAKRAAILFFVLYDMSRIDPMYQFSLDSYILLFNTSIERSPRARTLEDRINVLNEFHTYATYKNTCRGLFENHKLLFSFHMCIKILEAQGKILNYEYNFLLKGGVVLDKEDQLDNPCAGWLTEAGWDNITELDKLAGFHGVVDTFEQYPRDWYQWYINTNPETLPLIGEWEDICNEFQRLLFIRSLRQDRLSCCVSNFIMNNLGPQFIEPPVLDIRAVLDESMAITPLIFVLSPGVDPTSALTQLADANDMTDRFSSLSLGQGQAPIATKMIEVGIKEGHWVFLANCHLSLSWMPALDKIVELIQTNKKTDPDFRLWLSSSPHPDFPISILQAGIKMTTEPPRGIKANLKRLYRLITEEQFSACKEKEKYKKLLFSLCFFHAVLLERKKFQQLGWNIIYSFNDSDFEVSECLLQIYLDEYKETPWDALKYLIAGVNYGGHVTDDWDRRLLLTYVNQYFCDDALYTTYYRLSSLETYFIPKDGNLTSYLEYINILPNVDHPEAFGQHSNADITSLITEARCLSETLMSLQVQAAGTQAESKEEKVAQIAADVFAKIPQPIDYETTWKNIGDNKQPLDVVLLQEISRYNVLLNSILTSLDELQKSIKGLVVMSSELEDIFVCMYEGRVPANWLRAYPSLKQLGSWTRDLILRVEHFSVWADTVRAPLLFWLAAYTFPTGFLTAVLQTTARSTQVPIDQLNWEFEVVNIDESMINDRPLVGVYVRGLYLEGAGWDKKANCIIEAQPMQLVYVMPLINFKPMENVKKHKGWYVCPCYYFPIRSGVQGRPAYVVSVDLKCSETPDFWTKRGTALLLSLAN